MEIPSCLQNPSPVLLWKIYQNLVYALKNRKLPEELVPGSFLEIHIRIHLLRNQSGTGPHKFIKAYRIGNSSLLRNVPHEIGLDIGVKIFLPLLKNT